MRVPLALLPLILSAAFCVAQCIPTSSSPRVETFAAVKDVENQGKAGSRLRLEETGNQITAILRDYLGGGKVLVTKLTGTINQAEGGVCKVLLSGRNQNGLVQIEGEITNTRFQGIVKRQMGKGVFSHAISLKRQLSTDAPEMGPTVS